MDGRIRASVTVTNSGERAGQEAVLWFLTDETGTIRPTGSRVEAFSEGVSGAGRLAKGSF